MSMPIFLSYSSLTRSTVQNLANDLESLGYSVWFDRNISGGREWWSEILKNIRNCDLFIFALSEAALNSEPCLKELRYAEQLRKRIFPVRIQPIDISTLPLELQKIQIVEYDNSNTNRFLVLNKAIVNLPPAESLPSPIPPEPPIPLPIRQPANVVGFKLLTPSFFEKLLEREKAEAAVSGFYDGTRPNWLDVISNRDTKRDKTESTIEALTSNQTGFVVSPFVGKGGSGKSTFLMRLVYELTLINHPVLYHSRDSSFLDATSIINFAQFYGRRIFLAIDDAARVTNLQGFMSVLAEHNLNITLLIASRTFEWKDYSRSLPTLIPSREIITANLDELSNAEIQAVIEKLSSVGKIRQPENDEINEIIEHFASRSKRSMLPLILLLHKGESISAVINDELQRLQNSSTLLYRAYKIVCLLNAMNSYASRQLLAALCNNSEMITEIITQLPGYIEEIGDQIVARHDAIADVVVENIFADDPNGFMLFSLKILKKAIEIGYYW